MEQNNVNVVFLSCHPKAITGAHVRFDRLVNYELKKNKNSRWITVDREDLDFNILNNQVTVLSLPESRAISTSLFAALFSRRKSLVDVHKDSDVVVVFGETPLLAGYYLSKILNNKLSVGVRSNLIEIHSILSHERSFYRKISLKTKFFIRNIVFLYLYKKATQIVVQTEEDKKNIYSAYNIPLKKVFVINNNITSLPVSLRKKVSQRVHRVKPLKALYIGSKSKIKGHDILINTLKSIDNSRCSIKEMTIIGDFDDKNIDINGIAVRYIGFIKEVRETMLWHDILIVPSLSDSFPNVVLEAFSTNLPIIGSDIGGIKYMLNDPSILFNPRCLKSILECIYYVSTHQGYAKAIEIAEQRKHNFDFNWELKYKSVLNAVG